MAGNDFVEFVCDMFDELKAQFLKKMSSTQESVTRLQISAQEYYEMYEEAKGYARKHIAHIMNNNIYGNKVDESLKDIAIYSIIMLYMYSKA